MMTMAGMLFGQLFCAYHILFRWETVRKKYGMLDLYWWLYYCLFSWWLFGLAADIAIWGVRYAIWTIRYGTG